jgi:hypothetical protein
MNEKALMSISRTNARRFSKTPPDLDRMNTPLTTAAPNPTWGGTRPGAGRPRLNVPRCACGANTLSRAHARRFECCRKAGVVDDRARFLTRARNKWRLGADLC